MLNLSRVINQSYNLSEDISNQYLFTFPEYFVSYGFLKSVVLQFESR
jgi:hypothetical protein